MDDRQLIEDLLSALEYHTEQTRPIEFSKVAIEAAREYLRKPAQQMNPEIKKMYEDYFDKCFKESSPTQQEPVAYDKTELNCFAQDLYDQKMREGKRGHYESMFHVIHQCIKKVAPPPPQRTWVGLTDDEVYRIAFELEGEHWRKIADAIEAKLKEKNGG